MSVLCVACLNYLFGPGYSPTPDFGFPDVIEQTTKRYRSEVNEVAPVFDVEEARYILADSSFDTEGELRQCLDTQITQAGWTDNDTLSEPISPFCDRITFDSQQASIKAYASNKAIGAVNRGAAPHLCVITRHYAEDHYYEVVVATFDPTLISALAGD